MCLIVALAVINSNNIAIIYATTNPTATAKIGLNPLLICLDLNNCLLFLSVIFAINPPIPVNNKKSTKMNITIKIPLYPTKP